MAKTGYQRKKVKINCKEWASGRSYIDRVLIFYQRVSVMMRSNGDLEQKIEKVNRLKAEQALQILAQEIARIRYVKDWAREAGCTQRVLNELVKRYFRINSKQLLKEVRYSKICKLIEENPDITSYSVACSCGLHDEQGLFKFLKRHFNTTYSDIRYEVLLRHLKDLNNQTKMDSSIKKWLE